MMKHRIVAMTLALIMCVMAFLIGPHLVFHEDPECHETPCFVCRILRQNDDIFVCLLAAFATAGLLCAVGRGFLGAASENQMVPGWTPVRLKVKLLN